MSNPVFSTQLIEIQLKMQFDIHLIINNNVNNNNDGGGETIKIYNSNDNSILSGQWSLIHFTSLHDNNNFAHFEKFSYQMRNKHNCVYIIVKLFRL
jgi:hypothetical protein